MKCPRSIRSMVTKMWQLLGGGSGTPALTSASNTFTATQNMQDILPATDLTYKIGSSTKTWGQVYTQDICDASGGIRISVSAPSGVYLYADDTGANDVNASPAGVSICGAAGSLGMFGASAVPQPASANQAALSLTGSYTGSDTINQAALEADIAALQTLVNQLRADLVSLGAIKGSA
jgi:hypothetical protein